jgi:translation elongation factor EF-1beta
LGYACATAISIAAANLAVDDETDMAALEASVRSIEKDGLVWGASKLLPIG